MIDEIRPNPDQILETFNKREKKKRGGRLYLFIGMAPGVGKTFAMILAAQEAKKDGVDVVAGVVETHGRKDTEALLAGLTFLPKTTLHYRDKDLLEMDLDGILARKPGLVLVDELAHTNAPGSRHAKRWQDVYEILDAGIDVFSTLNVQHVESRKETVEQIAGIRVNETVPDSVFDRAHQIRLIDLSPQDLLRRLREGKVYLGDQAQLAQENFFKEDKLTALREISLRLTAEKVDVDLQAYSADRAIDETWLVSERLLVLIGTSSSSEALIRAARKQAFNLEAPWIAVYVDTAQTLNENQKASLAKNLQLAHSLGAEVMTLTDTDVAQAIIRLAVQRNVTQIIIGRRSGGTFSWFWHRTSLLEKLLKSDISIQVVQESPANSGSTSGWMGEFFHLEAGIGSYLSAGLFILSLTLINYLLISLIGYRAVGFIFLFGTLLLSVTLSFGPIIFMATMTALIWGIFFIPPQGKLQFDAAEDIFMVATYLVAAIATGILTRRSIKHQRILAKRERRAQILYEISQEIASKLRKEEMITQVGKKMGDFLNAQCDVILARKEGGLKNNALERLKLAKIDKEMVVAQWVFDNQKPAGWSTDTLAGAEALYVPLPSNNEKIGVLVFKPNKSTNLLPADQELIFSVAGQLAMSLEKEILREKVVHMERLKELDKMHRTILTLITETMRQSSVQVLSQLESVAKDIADSVLEPLDKMKLSIDNLLLMSRIAIGIYPLQKAHVSAKGLLLETESAGARLLKNNPIKIDLETDFELSIDNELIKKALLNILINAAQVSPKGTIIEVRILRSLKSAVIMVQDQGNPDESVEKIFEKFSLSVNRDQRSIGYAVAKGIIKAHGGKISASNDENGGIITISLPI